MRKLCLVLSLCIASIDTPPSFADKKLRVPCEAYIIPIQHDADTVNLFMAGPDSDQKDWYQSKRNSKDVAGVCVISPDGTDDRISIDEHSDISAQVAERIGSAPVFTVVWAKSMVVGGPDQRLVGSADGILYKITDRGNPIAIGPVHNTNVTAMWPYASSISASLLEEAIRQIKLRRPNY